MGGLWWWFHRSRTGVKTLVEGRHAVGLFPGAGALRRLTPLTTHDILPRRLVSRGLVLSGLVLSLLVLSLLVRCRSVGPDLLLGRVLTLLTLIILLTLLSLARIRIVQFLLPGRGRGVGVLVVAGGFHTDREAE